MEAESGLLVEVGKQGEEEVVHAASTRTNNNSSLPASAWPRHDVQSKPSKRQRRRKRKRSFMDDMKCDVQSMVGEDDTVYTLLEFLEHCVPAFSKQRQHELQPLLRESDQSKELSRCLKHLLLIPSPNFPFLTKISVGCRQDLPSLVDHVVWTLVQRREQAKLLGAKSSFQQCNNLLCQGYAIQEQGIGPMTLKHLNSMVDFCQTAPIFLLVHKWLGDDLLRVILLHTTLLVPIFPINKAETAADDSPPHVSNNVNFMQVTGPPLQSQTKRTKNKKNSHRGHLQTSRQHRQQAKTTLPANLQPYAIVPDRRSILYADFYIPHVGLPKHHVLQRTDTDPSKLCLDMFRDVLVDPSTVATTTGDNSTIIPRYWSRWQQMCRKVITTMNHTAGEPAEQAQGSRTGQQQVWQICQGILQRHGKCDYHRLLDRHCPIDRKSMKQRDDAKKWLTYLAIKGHVTHDSVTAWMCNVLQKIFTVDCWGSTHNQSVVLQELIPKYIRLGRDEIFVNKTLMERIKVTHFGWLVPLACLNGTSNEAKLSASDHQRLQCLVLSFLRWVISDFVSNLLRSVFYVTDSEFAGKTVLYYRRPIWALFRNLSLRKLMEQQYQPLTEAKVQERLNQQEMGLSRLRLLPKSTGVRPLATLCKRESVNLEGYQSHFLSTNRVLGDAFSVLKYEYTRDEERFGCGMPGLYYFYPRYREFIVKLKQERESGFQLFFGSVDIRNCFDKMDQQHLLCVIDGVLSEDDYILQRYSVLHPSRGVGPPSKRQKKEVRMTERFDPFFRSVQDLATEYHHCIFVDGMSCATQSKELIMRQLREHLSSHLTVAHRRHGKQYLVQATGIPQGSVLSNLLCNFYYGNVEKRLFGNSAPSLRSNRLESNLMVRMTDDFMFVSTETTPVKEFVETMRRGDQELGVQINNEKTCVSTPMDLANPDGTVERLEPNVILMGPAGSFFTWCGMLFNCHSGEVQMDYSRFFEAQATNAVTVDRTINEGEQLLVQMKLFARPRCIPILFDPHINSYETQTLNFYQLMVLVAVRTAEYVRNADLLQLPNRNMSFLRECIESTCIFSFKLICERLESQLGEHHLGLNRETAVQLGWTAVHDVCAYIAELRMVTEDLKANFPDAIKKHRHLHGSVSKLLSPFLSRRQ